MFNFEEAAAAAEAASNAGTLQEEMASVYAALKYREEIQIALTNQKLARCSGPAPGHERLPFRDETGTDFGRVEARIPKDLFYGLKNQKSFGEDGLYSDDGIKDLLKAFPQCKVTTISGKTTVGWNSPRAKVQRPKSGVNFGRGTLNLAT